MIFITLGSQKFQFNRLLQWIDQLIEEKKITVPVFAQIGYSDYKPKQFPYQPFLNRSEFIKIMEKSQIIITHGGTGAIITGLKNEKKVIAVPRKAKFQEHVDDHQNQIVSEFGKMNFLLAVNSKKEMEDAILMIEDAHFESYVSSTDALLSSIESFIDEEL